MPPWLAMLAFWTLDSRLDLPKSIGNCKIDREVRVSSTAVRVGPDLCKSVKWSLLIY